MNRTLCLLIFGVITLSLTYCQVNVLGPPALVSKLKKYSDGGRNFFKRVGLDHALGNFGIIPYSKTAVGYVFYHKHADGTNNWCNFEKTNVPIGLENVPDSEYYPIFLVD